MPGPRRDTAGTRSQDRAIRAVRRAPRPVFVLVCAVLLVLVGGSGSAHAAGYRYWSFWDLDGTTWTYAAQGPSVADPSDGAVQGFRFSVSEDSQDASKPRGAHDFASICHDTPAKAGEKRVALVVDFGTAADAPEGETPPKPRTACARVADDASSAEALASVAKPLRYDSNALLCAIAGYPRTGCGEQISGKQPTHTATASPSASRSPHPRTTHHTPSVGLIAGVAAVALLGIAAIWQARRRRG